MPAQRKENVSSWWRQLANNGKQDIEENQWFGNSDRINFVKFNAISLKLAEKFDHPFLDLFMFGNIFVKVQGFDDMTVKTSKYCVSLHFMIR